MAVFAGHFDQSKFSKHKIELHVHLDGCPRVETIWDLSQKKGIQLAGSIDELRNMVHIKQPTNLVNFLKPIIMYLPVFSGDPDALERMAYEFCEDSARQHILYAEVRYSPHLMSSTHGVVHPLHTGTLSPRDVVLSVTEGLEKGSRDFGIKIRSILCSIRGRPGWTTEVAELCKEFRNQGVVGMDIAGDDRGKDDTSEEVIEAFKLASASGIHRTVHAGEDGPASQVRFAVEELLAERVGHGYRVLEDPAVYADVLLAGVHFETCPHSSLLTGAVSAVTSHTHPIVRFVEDGLSFSINRDDSTLTQTTLKDDYDLLRTMGLSDIHFTQANFNAAHSCFLPEKEKRELLKELSAVYRMTQE